MNENFTSSDASDIFYMPAKTRLRISLAILQWTLSLVDGNEEFENIFREEVEIILDAIKNGSFLDDEWHVVRMRMLITAQTLTPIGRFVVSFIFAMQDLPYTKHVSYIHLSILNLASRMEELKLISQKEYFHSIKSLIANVTP